MSTIIGQHILYELVFWSTVSSRPRLLDTIEPGIVMLIHWYRLGFETVVYRRGHNEGRFYDESGYLLEVLTLFFGGRRDSI